MIEPQTTTVLREAQKRAHAERGAVFAEILQVLPNAFRAFRKG